MQLRNYQLQGIDEIRAAFRSGIKRTCYVAPCGAGKGTMVAYMARQAANKGNHVLFTIHRRELLEQIQDDIGKPHPLIQLGTVQSIARRLPDMIPPQLIISDEHHHGVAATWRKIFDYFKNAYLVGLTATPARLNGSGLGEICDKLIIGPSVQELIDRGFLAPFKYYAPPMPVDFTDIKIKLGDYDQGEISIRMDKPHITGRVIDHYRQFAEGKQAIIYCAGIQHSNNTVEQFRAAGYTAMHVDGETPAEVRRQAVADFKSGKLTIMSNVQLFGEGLNLPGVEVVILLRPTQSLTLNLQQSMRSMRPGPNKTAIIIDAVGNCFRHGIPTTPHEWSLDGVTRRKRGEVASVGVRRCLQCYGCHSPAPVCPYCGYVYNLTPRQLAQEAGELKEYDARIAALEKKKARMTVGMARTRADLEAIAKERGYSAGWVWHTAKAKKIRS